LPAHVVVYYVLALTLYMQVSYREVLRCLLEGVKWLLGPEWEVKVAGKSGISQARTRLGWEPLQQLHDEVVAPIAVESTKGAWYRHWRSVSLDGSTMDVADNHDNEKAFGRPAASRGTSAYPQVRFVSLVENGTHVMFGTQMSGYGDGEIALAHKVLPSLKKGMLCLADRNFFGFDLWKKARATGADLLWRVKKNLRLPCEKRLSDGSYWSTIYRSDKDRRRGTKTGNLQHHPAPSGSPPNRRRSLVVTAALRVEHRAHFRLPEPGDGFANPDNDPRGPWKADPFQVV